MEQFSFIFTIFFMLLGPVKIIPPFAGLTQGADVRFKRDVAIRGAVIASVLCAFVALAGGTLLGKYRISIDAVRIAGGLVLLIAALQVIFQKSTVVKPQLRHTYRDPTRRLAGCRSDDRAACRRRRHIDLHDASPEFPGMTQAVAICLATIMVLDFLVMYFIDRVMKTPGLMIVLTVLGSVLVFVQAALAIQMILTALKSLGVIKV